MTSDAPETAAVSGFSAVADGTRGDTRANAKNGVVGTNDSTGPVPAGQPGGNGVFGFSKNPQASGVFGANDAGFGVAGFSANNIGVLGRGKIAGRFEGDEGGVAGVSANGDGTRGDTHANAKNGVVGTNDSTGPVPAGQPGGNGVFGFSKNPHGSGVFGANDAGFGVAGFSANNIGVLGRGKIAGRFEGDVEVTGDIKLLGADCAEDFDVTDPTAAEPGTVMVLDDAGGVRVSDQDYDSRVAGVVSGAGSYNPALILDRQAPPCESRRPLALMGKVWCKVDATDVAVAIGDLLTTSSTPGHAMKAVDQRRAFGAVIGKALQPCAGVRGLIPILVALQ